MTVYSSAARPSEPVRGMFNQEIDPRRGHDDAPPKGSPSSEGEPPPPPPPPPPPRPGRGSNQGPPDLDELWRDFNRRLSSMFGGGNGRGGRRGGGKDFQPNMKAVWLGLGVLVVAALLIWLGSGTFTVQEGSRAVITRFGRYQTTVDAGFQWRLPYPIEQHETVELQIRSSDVGGDNVSRSTGLRDSAMLTQDKNIVEIKFAVQYRVNDARAYKFNSDKPNDAVVQAAESAARDVVGQMNMDSAIGDERDRIAPRVSELTQKILDRYQLGIQIVAINIAQDGVRPPDQVKEAFDDVIKAGQEREGAKNEAQAYANNVVPRATGTAARLTQEAEGYKARVVAQAQGDSERFAAVLVEYQKAPKVTRDRLYLDAMRQIYENANKVIVDGKSGANLLYLPLDKIMQSANAPATAPQQPADAAQSPPTSAPAPSSIAPLGTDAADVRGRDNARNRERNVR